jgi:DivIVA domain-containing protein
MTDEAFRLTSLDVRRWDFGSALRGYDKARVDDLREQVADELERLARANQELDAKARGFHEQLRAFRERDKALNDALVTAQQLRAETREQADREAQLILREARAEAERIVDAARGEARRIASEIDALERSRRAFIAQMRAFIDKQVAELDAAEAAGSAGHNAAQAAAHAAQSDDPRRAMQTPAWLDPVKAAQGE